MKEIFPGIFLIEDMLFVENLIPNYNPFGDRLMKIDKKEYITWNPQRSKLAAAIIKDIKLVPIKKGSSILYMGAAHGYTCSKISCVVGEEGIIYAIEFSERCFNELLPLCEKYKNIIPILSDCRKTENYSWIEKVDIVYCDIADPQEVEIFIRNCNEFLKKDGYGMIAIKSRSIDVTKSPKEIYKESLKKLEEVGFDIIDWKTLDPLEKAHAFIIIKMI